MSVIRIHNHCWGVDVPKEGLELVVEFVWDKWLMARWKTEPTSTRWREYLYYQRHEQPYVDDAYAGSVHRGAISVRDMISLPVNQSPAWPRLPSPRSHTNGRAES